MDDMDESFDSANKGSPARPINRPGLSVRVGSPITPTGETSFKDVRTEESVEVPDTNTPGVLFHHFHELCKAMFLGSESEMDEKLLASCVAFYLPKSEWKEVLEDGGRGNVNGLNAVHQLNKFVTSTTLHWAARSLRGGILFHQNPEGHGSLYFLPLTKVCMNDETTESSKERMFVKVGCSSKMLKDRASELAKNFYVGEWTTGFVIECSWKLMFLGEHFIHRNLAAKRCAVGCLKKNGEPSVEVFRFTQNIFDNLKGHKVQFAPNGDQEYHNWDVLQENILKFLEVVPKRQQTN